MWNYTPDFFQKKACTTKVSGGTRNYALLSFLLNLIVPAFRKSVNHGVLWSSIRPESTEKAIQHLLDQNNPVRLLIMYGESVSKNSKPVGLRRRAAAAKRRRLARQPCIICSGSTRIWFFLCHPTTNLPRLLPPPLVLMLSHDMVKNVTRDRKKWKAPDRFCCHNHEASWTQKPKSQKKRPVQTCCRTLSVC